MTYYAPRIGLFAIIVLISLTLNVLFFVMHNEKQINARFEVVAKREAKLLADELVKPLIITDRVTMGVLANRYMQTDDVSFVGVYDSNKNLLVSLGEKSAGVMVQESANNHSNVVGYASIQMSAIDRAEIISKNWLYLLGVMSLHGLLWIFYTYLAKPTSKLRLAISQDVRNRLLAKELLHEVNQERHDNHAELPYHSNPRDDNPQTSTDPIPVIDGNNAIVVQITFDDPNELLTTVSTHTKTVYFSLCQQLVIKATHELLSRPLLYGVQIVQMSEFSETGCAITLIGQDKYSKTALAGIMLAHLVLMLNHIIYTKHRELKRFALHMRTFVATPARVSDVVNVGIKHRKTPLILLPSRTLDALVSHGDFLKLTDPTSVAERECRYAHNLSLSHVQTIEQVRDKVLLSD